MKLVRFGAMGNESPGLLLSDGTLLDMTGKVGDYDEAFFARDEMRVLRAYLAEGCPDAKPVARPVRLGAPVHRPSKIVCAGLNYRSHSQEFSQSIPKEPALFLKASSALSGPTDAIFLPPHSEKLDYEVELAVVISHRACEVDELEAVGCIAGYTLMCDVSERSWQIDRGGQWTKGKSYDSFAPLGPCLVTPDEMPSVDQLRIWLNVNGKQRQSDVASSMICSIPQLVSYASRFMTLMPGDVLSSGTPGGVAMGMSENGYLSAGDVIEMGGTCLGEQIHRIRARHEAI